MADPNNGSMTGADRLNHAAAIGSQKHAAKRGGISPGASHNHPLYGLGEAQHEIISASGLGRRRPDAKTRGEKMSDADGPTQDVKVRGGKAVHRKKTSDGKVTQRDLVLSGPPDAAIGVPRWADERLPVRF